jgi:hypothetical protein
MFDNPYLGLDFTGDNPTPTPADTGNTGEIVDTSIPTVHLGRTFHLVYPRMKHEENSRQGVAEALGKHYDSIDFDLNKDAQGIIQVTHWQRPLERDHFTDPEGKVAKNAEIRHMNSAVVARLRALTHGKIYKIEPASVLVPYANGKGLKGRLECKPGNKWTVDDFRTMRQQFSNHKNVIATMDNWSGWQETLKHARAAGWDTRRLRQ